MKSCLRTVFKHSLVLPIIAVVTSANAGSGLERAGDFALLDSKGNFHQLSRFKPHKALVLLSVNASGCANSKAAVIGLNKLSESWADKGVAFALLDSTSAQNQANQVAAEFPLLLDHAQLVAETLKVDQFGQAVVLDPYTTKVLYRGPVSDQMTKVLAAKVAGEELTDTVNVATTGCAIEFPVKQQHVAQVPDYVKDIAPLVQENCAECHHVGGIGPFAMDSYTALRGWSPMIREVLLTKRMPPVQVDPNIGHFSNARYLSNDDLQTLVHWIDAGSPRGNSQRDPLQGMEFAGLWDWQLGEPDYIVNAPVHDVPATGVIDYINENVELTFDEDKWVRAVQFIPGDPAVLHHLLSYVTGPTENFDGGEGGRRSVARRFLEGYAPGKIDAMTFPENTGVFIPKGHKLSMQFHYTTNGKATTDATKLGLYFYDEPPKYEYLNRSVSGMFKVPPHAQRHAAEAQYVFEEDVVVHGLRAHMHFRGHDMKFTAEFPDGTTKTLLNVPNYSYAWQPTYQLDEPVTLPAGTTVHVTGHFDNSEFNPANPDPSKELTFGLQSWDEMFIGYWSYHTVQPVHEKSGLEVTQK